VKRCQATSEETANRDMMRRQTWTGESSKSRQRGPQASSPSFPHFTLNVLIKQNNSPLNDAWTGNKPYHMTIDTRMSVANIILDLTGFPVRKPSQPHILLAATRETLHLEGDTGAAASGVECITNLGVQ
jgi:hypothetical protein